MKKPIAAILLAMATLLCHAQNVTGKSPVKATTINNTPAFDFSANAETLVASIVNVVGLKQNFTIKASKVLNVEAVIRHGERYIKYNPDYVNSLNMKAKDKWASVFVLAHEIGHHLNGHTVLKKNRPPAVELEADEFAGFVMNRMGATLEQAKLSVMYVASPVASQSHPGMADRILAIEAGWNRAVQH